VFKINVPHIFSTQLCFCWGHTEESLSHLPRRTVDKKNALVHPELYEDAMLEGKFFCLLSKLFRICGYFEFGFKDLQSPQHKRLKRQLSALINFMRYRQDKEEILETTLSEREEMFNALDEVMDDHEALKQHLGEAKNLNHEKQLEQEEAEAECKEMEMELAQQNKIQASIRQETLVLKKNANQLKDEIDTLSITLRELQAEERQFSAKVVHSPEKIKMELAEANKELENVKKMMVENDDKRKSLQMDIERLIENDKSVENAFRAVVGSDERMQKYEVVVEDREGIENELEFAEGSLNDMMKQQDEHSKQVDLAGEIIFILISSLVFIFLANNYYNSPFTERNRINLTTKLKNELENAEREHSEAFEKLGIVEGEMLDRIAKIEDSQKRVEEIETNIKEEKLMENEWIADKIESFRKFEKSYQEKEISFSRLLFG